MLVLITLHSSIRIDPPIVVIGPVAVNFGIVLLFSGIGIMLSPLVSYGSYGVYKIVGIFLIVFGMMATLGFGFSILVYWRTWKDKQISIKFNE